MNLPNFIIIGVDKGGTTSLFYYLAEHSKVIPPVRFPHWDGGKEIHYFSLYKDRSLDWYRAKFPKLSSGQITGEASGTYLSSMGAPERMHAVVPEVKLIALLRDPVARAISNFKQWVREEKEHLVTFSEAINNEAARSTESAWDPMAYAYLGKGLYLQHLRRWHRLFNREQLLILKSEDLFSRPRAILNEVTDFLEIDRYTPANVERVYNEAPEHQGDWQIESDARAGLEEYFRPHNRALYEYLGRDFGW
jgi:hypothetical protein